MSTDEGDGDREERDTSMLPQPETKLITQEQLVNEVKGIYAGLVVSSPSIEGLGLFDPPSPLFRSGWHTLLLSLHVLIMH